MRFQLTNSQIEARRAIQCLLVHIEDPGMVFNDEEYALGGSFRTAIYRDKSGGEARILLQMSGGQWLATRIQYWPESKRVCPDQYVEFALKPIPTATAVQRLEIKGQTWFTQPRYELMPVGTSPVI